MFEISSANQTERLHDKPDAAAVIARQPIFDRRKNLHAYELLFRAGDSLDANVSDGEQATAAVVTASFLDIGMDRIVDQHLAFINVTHEFLVSRAALALPADKVVLEILEDVVVDAALVDAVREYVDAGYCIALDDFEFNETWRPLLELAQIVKIDVMALSHDAIVEHLELLTEYNVEVLAEKVETQQDYERLHALGFHYFQGYFFAKPNLMKSDRLPANEIVALQLLAALQNPEADIDEVATLVARDPGLSYRLMRFMTSAVLALPETVTSIQRAVVYIGLTAVKRWVALMVLASASDKPTELTRMVLVRARMTEKLCARTDGADADFGFTIGMFSALDAFMDRSLPELLQELPLSQTVLRALLEGEGAEGEILQCSLAWEKGNWDSAEFFCPHVDLAEMGEIYAEAVEWAADAASVSQSDS